MQWLGRLLVCTRIFVVPLEMLHVTQSLRCHVQLLPLEVPEGMHLGLSAHVNGCEGMPATLTAGVS